MTLDHDARFWMAFYRFAVLPPSVRYVVAMTEQVRELQWFFSDAFTPIFQEVTWDLQDFGFAAGLLDQPAERPKLWRIHRAIRRWRMTWGRWQRGCP